ncbi:MAG: SMC-Scp complex subunit ScpB [Rhodospirillaceae bacterium]
MSDETLAQPADADAEPGAPPAPLPLQDPAYQLRLVEALLFAATEPLDESLLASRLPGGAELAALLGQLQERYAGRGIELVRLDRRWAFRTAADLGPYLRPKEDVQRKLSRAAVETLAIIAYHQPVTRAEIESIRGVATSKGTLDLLMENNWIKPGRRRETPGRPLTWVSTDHFLDHFGLASLRDLPGVEDLRAAGLLDARPVLATLQAPVEGAGPVGSGGDSDEG